MRYSKSLLCGVVAMAVSAVAAPGARGANWLPANAVGEMHVVVPEEASYTLRYAGEICRKYLQTRTYQEIGLSPYNEGKFNVWLGAYAVTEDVLPREDIVGLGEEGCLVRTFNPSPRQKKLGATQQLLIAGETDLGTRNGVFLFLQDYAGFRWAAPGVVRPSTLGFVLPEYERRFEPRFAFREVSAHALLRDAQSVYAVSEDAFIEYRRAHGFAHDAVLPPPPAETLAALLPVEAFPECYHDGALCLSREKTASALTERFAGQLRDESGPALWGHQNDIVVLSAGAGSPMCACGACAVLRGEENSAAAPLAALANTLAERLRETFPERRPRVLALCLGPWRTPPARLRVADGVVVMLSTRLCNGARPLFDSAEAANDAFRQDIAGWRDRGATVYVWYWASNQASALCPHPGWETIQADMQFVDQYGAEGVYAQGNAPAAARYAASAAMRSYLLSACIFDPDRPAELATRDFCETYYGLAAPEMETYLRRMAEHIREGGFFLGHEAVPYWLEHALVTEMRELFHAALRRDLAEPFRARVELAELPVLYAALVCPPHIERVDEVLVLSRPPAPELDAYEALLRERGAAGAGDDPLVREARAACGGATPPRRQELPLTALTDGESLLWLVHDAAGAAVRWRDGATGTELLRRFTRWGAPGAWDERVHGQPVPGWRVAQRGPSSATLVSTLPDGGTLEKTISLEAGAVRYALRVTNGGAAVTARPVETRPEFQLQDSGAPELWRQTDGQWSRVEAPADPPGRLSGGLRVAVAAGASWAVRLGQAGPFAVAGDISGAETLHFSFDRRDSHRFAVLGLACAEAPLPAGGTRHIEAVYRILRELP